MVPRCKILELLVPTAYLVGFPTMWQYKLELWPSTLKNEEHLPPIMVINCINLYVPGAYGSFCIPPSFPTMWQYDLDLWPPTLKNNRHLSLIMLINCTKLQDPGLMVQSVSCLQWILPSSYYVAIKPWPMIFKNNRHLPLIMVINWSWIILYPAYNIFLLCDILTFNFDHRPWKTIGFFFSSCWWNVQSCKILELIRRQCILPHFPTIWPLTSDLENQ